MVELFAIRFALYIVKGTIKKCNYLTLKQEKMITRNTISLSSSSPSMLIDNLCTAKMAIEDAIEKLVKCNPNKRDYANEKDYELDMADFKDNLMRLKDMADELEADAIRISHMK